MNNLEFEKKLAESGFTGKDIAAMRQYLGQDGSTYPSLLSELRGRFIISCILISILFSVCFFYLFYGEKGDLLSFLLTMLVAAPVFYFMTPMKLGFKAFKYKMRS